MKISFLAGAAITWGTLAGPSKISNMEHQNFSSGISDPVFEPSDCKEDRLPEGKKLPIASQLDISRLHMPRYYLICPELLLYPNPFTTIREC